MVSVFCCWLWPSLLTSCRHVTDSFITELREMIPEFCNVFWLWCFSACWHFFLVFCLLLLWLLELLFELFWENGNCSVQTDILQRLHADSESWNNLLWVLVDNVKNKTGLMVVIHIYYVLNHAIKTEGWEEKMYFPNFNYLQHGGPHCGCVCSLNS